MKDIHNNKRILVPKKDAKIEQLGQAYSNFLKTLT